MSAPLRIACLGECMIELRPHAPGLWAQGFAGDTYNTAVYLRRLGGARWTVDYATGLGTDSFADDMLQAWQAEGIGAALARRIPGRSTGLYSIRTDARGERRFSYWRETSAARAYFDGEPSPLEAQADHIDVLYFSGITLAVMASALADRLPALLRRLRGRGARIVFDNNYRPALWRDAATARAAFALACAASDIALVTLDDEQALHPGLSPAQLLDHVAALPCAEVVVKRGGAPTLLRLGAGSAFDEVPVPPVARIVDTTAAGDSFAAGYLHGRLDGGTPAQAAHSGNRLAGIVIGHPGAIVPRQVLDAAWDAAAGAG